MRMYSCGMYRESCEVYRELSRITFSITDRHFGPAETHRPNSAKIALAPPINPAEKKKILFKIVIFV